ncbi:hypothetical protein KKF34_16045 [Myxococcota bacterium]|nr:hypothetical protein [Myxococcota bacterium]MBU1380211.1 hypothetical protein [Myxococcota bacterium]MBU1498389.1 hypothetical protein [Myxococcota bacterium]
MKKFIFTLVLVLAAAGCDDDSSSSNNNNSTNNQTNNITNNNNSTNNQTNNTNNVTPSCDDGIRNGSELGIDCGGDCETDCCSNGYTDANLGEWSPDCGGSCGNCYSGTVYFVSNTGDDDDDGLSPETAWATVAKVNSATLNPGDAVLFESGGTWRETLVISSSGTASEHITFASYGEGPKPQILGSERAENWTEVGTNIWMSESVLEAPRARTGNSVTNHPASIFFGEHSGSVTWGNMEDLHLNSEGAPMDIYECDFTGTQFELLDEEYDWCWQDNHIYVYSPENPGSRYDFIEVPQRVSAVQTADHPPEEYVTLNNLEMLFAIQYGYNDGWPMNVVVRGLNVLNCHIGWMGTKGAASAIGLQIWHSDMLVEGNDIHDCGRRNISYNVYGDVRDENLVFENVIFCNNVLHNGYHTTGFDISGGYTDTFRNFQFIGNFIWDNFDDGPDHPNDFTSMGIYLAGNTATFTDFLVLRNTLKYIKQKGLVVGNVKNLNVYHNTFYSMNHNSGGDYRGIITVTGEPTNLIIQNNILFGDVPNSNLVLSLITFSGSSHEYATINNNLYWQTDSSQRIVSTASDSWRINEWTSYLEDTSWDDQSPDPEDPGLTDPDANDFTPATESAAIDSGALIPGINDDYAGSAPDIGAIETP